MLCYQLQPKVPVAFSQEHCEGRIPLAVGAPVLPVLLLGDFVAFVVFINLVSVRFPPLRLFPWSGVSEVFGSSSKIREEFLLLSFKSPHYAQIILHQTPYSDIWRFYLPSFVLLTFAQLCFLQWCSAYACFVFSPPAVAHFSLGEALKRWKYCWHQHELKGICE